jgi:cytochrome c peroxidase
MMFLCLPIDGVSAQADSLASAEYNKEIKPILREKCFDCHTQFTHYPWYHLLPGIKQIINRDIRDGQRKMNITEGIQLADLRDLKIVIEDQSMPPLRYRWLHHNAALSKNEREKLLSWIDKNLAVDTEKKITQTISGEPILPLVAAVNLNQRKVDLGRQLFHDRKLSKDNTISCASCHSLDKGGTDQMARSVGVNGALGDVNSPTVFNSSLNFKQFWDGRATTLEEQAAGPIHNPKEMATSWKEIIAKLSKDTHYKSQFKDLYGTLSETAVANALAEFEKSLITPNSRFDKFLLGDADALTQEEKDGYLLFKSYGCASCHQGVNAGGNLFEKFGVMGNYFADRGNITKADLGRFNVTQKESDKYQFKIPSLRNVSLTPPYFHDGHAKTLSDAVKVMAKYQLGKKISDEDTRRIVQFLDTLTGEYEGKPLWISKK